MLNIGLRFSVRASVCVCVFCMKVNEDRDKRKKYKAKAERVIERIKKCVCVGGGRSISGKYLWERKEARKSGTREIT